VKPCCILYSGRFFPALTLLFLLSVVSAGAEEKSYYSPIIQIDKEKGWVVISNSGAVFAVQASEAAKPHLEKLPLSGLIDIVVDTQPEGPPIIKSWKLASGDSSCKVFDGKTCK
jgi:hypothetical protein